MPEPVGEVRGRHAPEDSSSIEDRKDIVSVERFQGPRSEFMREFHDVEERCEEA